MEKIEIINKVIERYFGSMASLNVPHLIKGQKNELEDLSGDALEFLLKVPIGLLYTDFELVAEKIGKKSATRLKMRLDSVNVVIAAEIRGIYEILEHQTSLQEL